MVAAEYEAAVIDSRRRSQKAPVSLDARLGRGGLEHALCKVVDLSIHGARLRSCSAMKRGSTIWLTLPGLPSVAADVMWATDLTAGCRFREPLTAEQFDGLIDRQP